MDPTSRDKTPTTAQSYSTAVEGNARVQRRYTITGRFDESAFLAFIANRADWLAIDGWAASDGRGRVELAATGPEALVGALEMACFLGPDFAVVDSIVARSEAPRAPPGFTLR